MKLAPLIIRYSLMSYPFLIVVIPPLRANSIAFWAVKPSAGFTFSEEVTITQPEIAYEWGKYTLTIPSRLTKSIDGWVRKPMRHTSGVSFTRTHTGLENLRLSPTNDDKTSLIDE